MKRTREEIAADYESKAAKLRTQAGRAAAIKTSKDVRKLLSTARSLKSIGGEYINVFDKAAMYTVASDLERYADQLIGQRRIDTPAENPL